jgi:hypothetical protein
MHAKVPAFTRGGVARTDLEARQAKKKRDQLEEGRKLIPSSTSNGGRKMYWLTLSIQQKN